MSQPTGGLFQKTDRAMSTGINGLETAVSDCWRIHQNVMDTTSALPNSWQGEAATAFTKLLATWDDDFNQIVTLLGQMQHNLEQNRRVYDATETENAGLAAGQ